MAHMSQVKIILLSTTKLDDILWNARTCDSPSVRARPINIQFVCSQSYSLWPTIYYVCVHVYVCVLSFCCGFVSDPNTNIIWTIMWNTYNLLSFDVFNILVDINYDHRSVIRSRASIDKTNISAVFSRCCCCCYFKCGIVITSTASTPPLTTNRNKWHIKSRVNVQIYMGQIGGHIKKLDENTISMA